MLKQSKIHLKTNKHLMLDSAHGRITTLKFPIQSILHDLEYHMYWKEEKDNMTKFIYIYSSEKNTGQIQTIKEWIRV